MGVYASKPIPCPLFLDSSVRLLCDCWHEMVGKLNRKEGRKEGRTSFRSLPHELNALHLQPNTS